MPDPKKEECPGPEDEAGRTDIAAEDQRVRRYYYDDAHGYEEYDPEKDDREDEDAD